VGGVDAGDAAPDAGTPDAGMPDAGMPPTTPPALWAAWPMARHDPQGRSQSPYAGPQAPVERLVLDAPNAEALVIGPDGTLYVAASDELIYAVAPTGQRLWWATRDDPPPAGVARYVPALAVGPDGTIYVASHNGPLYALAPDGRQLWRFTTGQTTVVGGLDISWFGPPIPAADGRLYVGERSFLYAFEPDGRLAWRFDVRAGDATSSSQAASPVLGADGTVYLAASYGPLYALDHGGAVRWSYFPGASRAIHSIGRDGTLAVLGAGVIEALDPRGLVRWSRPFPFQGYLSRGPDDGFTSTYPGSTVALDAAASPRWGFGAGGFEAVVDGDGTTYAGGLEGLWAIDHDGHLRWHLVPRDGRQAFAHALAADGTLYARYDGAIHALGGGGACEGTPPDCDDGDPCTVDSCLNASGCVHAPKCAAPDACSTATCAADGTCGLATAADGTACQAGFACSPAQACRAGACRPADDRCALPAAAWPVDGHDARHTRASPLPGPATFALRWPAPVPGVASYVVGDDGAVYVAGPDPRIVTPDGAVSAFQAGAAPTDLAIRRDGAFYLSSPTSLIAAAGPSGSLLWTFDLPAGLGPPAIDAAGTLYLGAGDYRLLALAPDGSLRWSAPTGSATLPRPTVAPDGTIYVVGPDLQAFAPGGALRWRRFLGSTEPPAVGPDGVVYLLAADGLRAIDPDGGDHWTAPVSAAIGSVGAHLALAADGTLVVTSGGTLSAFDPAGRPRWSFAAPDANLTAPVVDGEGTVYVGATFVPTDLFVPPTTATVYALAADGRLRGTLSFPPAPGAAIAALALGGDHTLYFVVAGALYAMGP